jgi:hypothetical protein
MIDGCDEGEISETKVIGETFLARSCAHSQHLHQEAKQP